MRYRKQTATGDYVFGAGGLDYERDTPEAVAGAVLSRLRLQVGEWFMDESAGTAWETRILGTHTAGTRDMEIYGRVLNTQGVLRITDFASRLNPDTRNYRVDMRVDTIYGAAALSAGI